jgi:hypothetical protein
VLLAPPQAEHIVFVSVIVRVEDSFLGFSALKCGF